LAWRSGLSEEPERFCPRGQASMCVRVRKGVLAECVQDLRYSIRAFAHPTKLQSMIDGALLISM
jgi:hypothetical protein